MSRFVSFLGGVLASVAALGTAAWLVTEYEARKDVERDNSDDGCLTLDTSEGSLPPDAETETV